MSDVTAFWVWAIGAVIGLVGVHSYATYDEMLRGQKEDDLRFSNTVLVVIWPLTIATVFTVGVFCFVFYWAPSLAVDKWIVQPRLRRVAREASAKEKAEAARYEVERGAHR